MPERQLPPGRGDFRRGQPQGDAFAAIRKLQEGVFATIDSDNFRSYLDVQARFHKYSPSNVALIMAQRPDATQVARYEQWFRMHRYVRKGEKGIKIVFPMFKKTVDPTSGEESRSVYFGVGHVFDVSQTEGEPLPDVEVPVLQESSGGELWALLGGVAEREGLRVETPPTLRGELMGFYEPDSKRIVVRGDVPQLQRTKTLAHELGHHFSGRTDTREESETVAESVAYVVLAHHGLDSGVRSFPYVATWGKDKKVLAGALEQIQKVSGKIIDGVERQLLEAEGVEPMAGADMVRTYRGYSEDSETAMGPEVVFVQDEDGASWKLKNDERHSPTGFSWGYQGSGPAQLARGILTDHLGAVPPPAVYQEFKRQFVARWEQGKSWSITGDQIDSFMQQAHVQELMQRDL